MQTFKITENYGNRCDECGQVISGKPSKILEIKGVTYVLCEDCFKRFLGTLYNEQTPIFEELIKTLAKKDRNGILKLINSGN